MSQITAIRGALLAAVTTTIEAAGPESRAEVVTGPQGEPSAAASFQGAARQPGPLRMIIRAYVGPPDDEATQDAVDRLLDASEEESISSALFADQHLGDHVDSLRILGSSGWRTWQLTKDSPPVLGCEVTVEVTPK